MTERQGVLSRMKMIEEYLERLSLESIFYQPEFLGAKTINEKIADIEQLTPEDAKDVLTIYNETNSSLRSRGCGWFDFQLHLNHLLRIDNMKIITDDTNGAMRLNAD